MIKVETVVYEMGWETGLYRPNGWEYADTHETKYFPDTKRAEAYFNNCKTEIKRYFTGASNVECEDDVDSFCMNNDSEMYCVEMSIVEIETGDNCMMRPIKCDMMDGSIITTAVEWEKFERR